MDRLVGDVFKSYQAPKNSLSKKLGLATDLGKLRLYNFCQCEIELSMRNQEWVLRRSISHHPANGDVSSRSCSCWTLFTSVPLIYFSPWVCKSLSWIADCMSSKFHVPGDGWIPLLGFNFIKYSNKMLEAST